MSIQEPQPYTFSTEDYVLLKGQPFYGLQFHHNNVGDAKESRVYIRKSSRTYEDKSLNINHINVGNLVRGGYRLRSVDTPYRISYAHVGQPHNPYDGQDELYHQPFLIWLEPINIGPNHIIAHGRMTYTKTPKPGYIDFEWKRKLKDIEDREHILQILEEDKIKPPFKQRITNYGSTAKKFYKIRILSDVTIADAFGLSDPNILAHTI